MFQASWDWAPVLAGCSAQAHPHQGPRRFCVQVPFPWEVQRPSPPASASNPQLQAQWPATG